MSAELCVQRNSNKWVTRGVAFGDPTKKWTREVTANFRFHSTAVGGLDKKKRGKGKTDPPHVGLSNRMEGRIDSGNRGGRRRRQGSSKGVYENLCPLGGEGLAMSMGTGRKGEKGLTGKGRGVLVKLFWNKGKKKLKRGEHPDQKT